VLGVLELAVDLRQRLLAGHGEDRVAEGDQDADQPQERAGVGRQGQPLLAGAAGPGSAVGAAASTAVRSPQELRKPADGITPELEAVGAGERREPLLLGVGQDGDPAPGDEEHHHDGGDLQDPHRVVRRLVDTLVLRHQK